MTRRIVRLIGIIPLCAGLATPRRFSPSATVGVKAGVHASQAVQNTAGRQEGNSATPATAGEHVRIETGRGALHFWIPDGYDPNSAGMVIYIHGYFATVDQTWTENRLDEQFQASGRNALFVAIEAPVSNFDDVSWKSLDELLRAVRDLSPFAVAHGPLVVVGHSGAFRTILLWLQDPRLHYLILLDGMYKGVEEYRTWLHPRDRAAPHRMVMVANDTSLLANQLARRTYGTARRSSIPAEASDFTPRETHARLLYLISQYNHDEMISSGKVIPVLLQIAPIKAVPAAAEKGSSINVLASTDIARRSGVSTTALIYSSQ